MNSATSIGISSSASPMARVGRLTPLPGVALRSHPDRAQLRQFLKELRLPLAAGQAMLDLVEEADVPEAVRMAMNAVRNHNEYLQQFVSDYAEFGRLEQDAVQPSPVEVALRAWLEQALRDEADRATELGLEVAVTYRSFLPDRVVFDAVLVRRAIAAVLHVAMQRALPGRFDVRISYEEAPGGDRPAQLVVEVATHGGGFAEIELGYVFAPFHVRDAAARPLLGLTLAQRLTELLGGELRVESPGRSVCSYRLALRAEPSERAVWIDPTGDGGHLGLVRPGKVLVVGSCERSFERCRTALQHAGYQVERAEREELVLPRIDRTPNRWCAIVVDTTCRGERLAGFAGAIRALGFGNRLLSLCDDEAVEARASGVDEVVPAPGGAIAQQALLAALQGTLLGTLLGRAATATAGTRPAPPDRSR
ncbi:MAG: sensor histidine kinase [Planctomycetota bacterium]